MVQHKDVKGLPFYFTQKSIQKGFCKWKGKGSRVHVEHSYKMPQHTSPRQSVQYFSCYSVDEYEKLWAAATGGRGTGRGRKKKVQKGVDKEKLKYGRGESKWEGFNAPIMLEGDEAPKDEEKDWEESDGGRRTSWFSRGWSGKTWPGRKVGHPEKPDRGKIVT